MNKKSALKRYHAQMADWRLAKRRGESPPQPKMPKILRPPAPVADAVADARPGIGFDDVTVSLGKVKYSLGPMALTGIAGRLKAAHHALKHAAEVIAAE